MTRIRALLALAFLLAGCAAQAAPADRQQAAPATPTAPGPAGAILAATPEPTATPEPPTATPQPTATAAPPTATPEPTALPSPTPAVINGVAYDAYIPAATKGSQAYQYSCEFDAAWVILQTYGIQANVDELIAVMPHDTSIEPYYVETADGFEIYGGDISGAFSGDYTSNFLARSTGGAMAPVFARYGLAPRPVSDRAGIEAALRRGELIWMKTTVDFKEWRSADWIMPDGRRHRTVLGNDHAVVVIGFNADSVVIRDVLGPTSSNLERPYEYSVDWPTFMAVWEAQSFDGLAVGRQP